MMGSNADTIAAFLEAHGLTVAQTAGVLGNLQQESGFNPAQPNPKEGAIGIAQWEGGRRTALDAYAKATGGSETNLGTQLGYLWSELTGPYRGVLANLKTTKDPATAAAYWDVGPGGVNSGTGFENSSGSSTGQRVNNADAIYQRLISGKSLGGITSASFASQVGAGGGGLGPGSGNIGAPIAGGGILNQLGSLGSDIASGTANAANGLPGEIESALAYFAKPVIKFLTNALLVVVGIVVAIIALVMLAKSGDNDNQAAAAPSLPESGGKTEAGGEGAGAEAAEAAAA